MTVDEENELIAENTRNVIPIVESVRSQVDHVALDRAVFARLRAMAEETMRDDDSTNSLKLIDVLENMLGI